MSAQLIDFPVHAGVSAAHVLAFPQPRRIPCGPVLRFYDLGQVARLVGLIGSSVTRRRQIETIRRLVADAGLPAPHNHRWRKGKHCKGAAAVCAASVWDAAKVDAWFEQPEPGAPGAASAAPAPADWREEMRARAASLAGGGR